MTAISTHPTNLTLKGQWRTLARIVWAIFTAMTVVMWLYVATTQIGGLLGDPAGTDLTKLLTVIISVVLMPVGFVGMGLLLFLRRSDDAMAILSSLALSILGAHLFSGVNNVVQNIPVFYIANKLVLAMGVGGFIAMVHVFPNGKFAPKWSRWPVIALIAVIVALILVLPIIPDSEMTPDVPLMMIGLVTGVIAQVYRYLRVSTATERQQTKFVLLGFVGPIVSTIFWIILSPIYPEVFSGDSPAALIVIPLLMALALLLPASLALAILRYRLWDIDYLINRTLVYALMTVVLGGMFAIGFVVVRAILTAVLGGEQAILAAIVPTALVFGLFNPVRRWGRRLVDQKVYGINVRYETPAGGQAVQSAPSQPRTMFGTYADMEPIGSGGMAEVYRAQDTDTGKTVAIKVMPARLASQDEFRRRFEREAKTVSALKHPHIVQMYNYGEINGTPFMALEYISGIDLSEYLHGRSMLPIDEARRLLKPVADALDYAHQQGVIHRDIKPSNVMIEQDAGGSVGRVVLMDFGIAKITDAASRLTNSGAMGTFDYMAPEQIRDAREVDGRADQYGLAVMAYQMLTGQLPFKATNTAAVLIAHLQQPAPDPRTVRPDLSADASRALLRALEKDAARRFGSAGEFVAGLG